MLKNFNLQIAVISDDALFLQQLREQLQTNFQKISLDFLVFENGKKFLQDSKNLKPQIVLAPTKNLGLMPAEFERQIQMETTQSAVIFFAPADVSGVEAPCFAWPLVEWGSFFEKFQNFIPEEIKQQAGLTRRTALADKLELYGQKYRAENSSKDDYLNYIGLIPVFTNNHESLAEPESLSLTKDVVAKSFQMQLPSGWLYFEFLTVFILVASSIWIYFISEDHFLFWVFAAFTGLATLSLILGRFFNPFEMVAQKK